MLEIIYTTPTQGQGHYRGNHLKVNLRTYCANYYLGFKRAPNLHY